MCIVSDFLRLENYIQSGAKEPSIFKIKIEMLVFAVNKFIVGTTYVRAKYFIYIEYS